jgi:hypothetical protein
MKSGQRTGNFSFQLSGPIRLGLSDFSSTARDFTSETREMKNRII